MASRRPKPPAPPMSALSGSAPDRPCPLSSPGRNSSAASSSVWASPEFHRPGRKSSSLDEPTSALDPEMTAEVPNSSANLAAAGQHIILSTHEMGFVSRRC